MRLAIPAYFYPTPGSPLWARVLKVRPHLVVVNPRNGPGTADDKNYAELIRSLRNNHIQVYGYVHTIWGERPLKEVTEDIGKWLGWQKKRLTGIFFDESATTAQKLPYYENLTSLMDLIGKRSILNPGTFPIPDYFQIPQTIHVTYETDMETYLAKTQPDWLTKIPSKSWHIIHSVPTAQDARKVARVARDRRAGYIWITSDTGNNPYDELPPYLEELKSFI